MTFGLVTLRLRLAAAIREGADWLALRVEYWRRTPATYVAPTPRTPEPRAADNARINEAWALMVEDYRQDSSDFVASRVFPP